MKNAYQKRYGRYHPYDEKMRLASVSFSENIIRYRYNPSNETIQCLYIELHSLRLGFEKTIA